MGTKLFIIFALLFAVLVFSERANATSTHLQTSFALPHHFHSTSYSHPQLFSTSFTQSHYLSPPSSVPNCASNTTGDNPYDCSCTNQTCATCASACSPGYHVNTSASCGGSCTTRICCETCYEVCLIHDLFFRLFFAPKLNQNNKLALRVLPCLRQWLRTHEFGFKLHR